MGLIWVGFLGLGMIVVGTFIGWKLLWDILVMFHKIKNGKDEDEHNNEKPWRG